MSASFELLTGTSPESKTHDGSVLKMLDDGYSRAVKRRGKGRCGD